MSPRLAKPHEDFLGRGGRQDEIGSPQRGACRDDLQVRRVEEQHDTAGPSRTKADDGAIDDGRSDASGIEQHDIGPHRGQQLRVDRGNVDGLTESKRWKFPR